MINKKCQIKDEIDSGDLRRQTVLQGLALLIGILLPLAYTGIAGAVAISGSSATTLFAAPINPPPTGPAQPVTNPTGTPAGNGALPITPPLAPDQCPQAQCIIKDYVNPLVKTLTATAGVIAVISLIVAGIQYSSAGGDPSKISAAKSRIGKTISAFLFFIFLYVFLNYIVPGGV